MRKFVFKILWFSLPLIILFSPGFIVLLGTGENYSLIDKILTSDKKYLIGYAYNEANYAYIKWKAIQINERKDILVIGSSRVLQFREEMFDSSFYNAGYTISSISDFMPFLQSIPSSKYPNLIIIGLDQCMFNKNWDKLDMPKKRSFWQNSFKKSPSASTLKSVYTDLFKFKYDLSVIFEMQDKFDDIYRIGLNAIVNNTGFRKDGSMLYGKQIEMLNSGDTSAFDFQYKDTYSRIKTGTRRFQYGNQSYTKAFDELSKFLDYCHQNNIIVIGFLPPFANEVFNEMKLSGKYVYIDSIYPIAERYFKKCNFELWNMTKLETINSNDNETLDGFHGGELAYLKILIYMLENGSIIDRYTSLERLKSDINSRKNNYIVYEY